MVDPDDTTELSDDALRNRLRQLRGEPVPEPAPEAPPEVPPMAAHQMPDLSPYGMAPLEITASKDSIYDSIRYEMKVRVLTDEARDRVLAAMRAGGPMIMPDVFPNIKIDGVVPTDYDSGTGTATLRAVFPLEDIVSRAPALPVPPAPSAVPPQPPGTPLLIVGRRDRAEQFARTQGFTKDDWRWVHRPRDLLGHGPGTHMRILDDGHPHSPEEIEELIALARDRQFYVEMVTFGAPDPVPFPR